MWAKADNNFWRNPKVRRAGTDAGVLFQVFLMLVREERKDGWLPGALAEAEHLWGELVRHGWDVPRVAAARQACLDADLLVELEDGALAVDGWDDEWRAICSKCRRANNDPRFSTCPTCRKGTAKESEPEQIPALADSSAQKRAKARSGAQTRAPARRQDRTGEVQEYQVPGTDSVRASPPQEPSPPDLPAPSEPESCLAEVTEHPSRLVPVLRDCGFGNTDSERAAIAQRLASEGLTRVGLEAVWRRCCRPGVRDRQRLFASMIRKGGWREHAPRAGPKRKGGVRRMGQLLDEVLRVAGGTP